MTNDVTITVKIVCRHCNGQGLIRRGRWIEDKHFFRQEHVTDEFDCEHCGGTGHTLEQITLDAQALDALRDALTGPALRVSQD